MDLVVGVLAERALSVMPPIYLYRFMVRYTSIKFTFLGSASSKFSWRITEKYWVIILDFVSIMM